VRLNGIHHITCITADGQRNVDFYAVVLGLRLVKKTINFDVPDAYHLYFADEQGTPGTILTFFEYPGISTGRDGAGMIHRISWRVRRDSLDFWADRLEANGLPVDPRDGSLAFEDPEGLGLELVADRSGNAALTADSPEIPPDHRLLGFDGVRAYSRDPDASDALLDSTLGFARKDGGTYEVGETRSSAYAYDPPPAQAGVEGAGTVHHIAWASTSDEPAAWRERVVGAGADVTEIIDRKYFRSIYFREPSGVLFEIATVGPGFTVDEKLEELGEKLSLPEWHESRRAELEARLTPIENPRSRQVSTGGRRQ
jgi:glyoxalase family protein